MTRDLDLERLRKSAAEADAGKGVNLSSMSREDRRARMMEITFNAGMTPFNCLFGALPGQMQ